MNTAPETEHSDKKELLLHAALDLFIEHGFDGTSVRMIAEKANMNVAMISYYFGSKEKLLEEVFVRKTEYMRNQLTSLLENDALDPWQKMERLIDNYSERIMLSKGGFHRLMMRELSLGQRPEVKKFIEERMTYNMKAIQAIIAAGVEKNIFRNGIDFAMLMSTLFGTLTQSVLSENLFCRFLDPDDGEKEINLEEHIQRVKKHMKGLFARYLLIDPSNYNFEN